MQRSTSLLVSLFLLVAACQSGEGPDSPAPDVQGDEREAPPADGVSPADNRVQEVVPAEVEAEVGVPAEPRFPAVTFNKRPYLQWPTKEGVVLLAETVENIPLDIRVEYESEIALHSTEPYQPQFDFLGVPLDGLDGYFHQVDVPVPVGAKSFRISIANADYEREVVLPQYLDSYTMVAFGDTRNQPDKHQKVADMIAAEKPLIVLQTGDLTAAASYVDKWEVFFGIEEETLEETFYFPIFGNHEIGGETFYREFFETRNSHGSERNYWIDLGAVGLIGMERYATSWSDPEPLYWLEEALQALQDKRWLIVSFHEPMYTFSNHGPWYEGRDVVQPLLEEYGVDFIVAGHNHCYERFEVNGIPHVVTGGGGAPLYSTGTGPEEEQELLENWGAFHHYLLMDVTPESLHVTVIDTEEETVFEEFTLE